MAGVAKFDATKKAAKLGKMAARKKGVTKADAKKTLKLSSYQWAKTIDEAKKSGLVRTEGFGRSAYYVAK